jgi:hypothetical protein
MPRKSVTENPIVVSTGAAPAPTRRKSTPTKKHVGHNASVEVSDAAAAEQVEVSREAIAQLAYSYWVERGYQGGSPDEDWLRAEQALLSK